MKTLVISAIIGALSLAFGAASFADTTEVPQVRVKYGDLNVSNPQGAASLYSRIAAAAHVVCKDFDIKGGDFASRTQADACIRKAIAEAVTYVGQPELFAVYSAKTHQSLPTLVASVQAR